MSEELGTKAEALQFARYWKKEAEQLRKENKCLIKIIEDRDILIAESYKTNAENHKLRAEIKALKEKYEYKVKWEANNDRES